MNSVADSPSTWICSTPNISAKDSSKFTGEYSELVAYDLHGNFGVDNDFYAANIGAMELLQTAFQEDAWQVLDGSSGSTGEQIVLSVRFLNGDEAQRALVAEVVAFWEVGNPPSPVRFSFVGDDEPAQIKISFDARNYSEIGRQALKKRGWFEPTMFLRDVTTQRNERSHSVIAHEFGHALGLRHEHQHPDAGIVWNDEVVVRELEIQGLEMLQIRKNVLEPLSRSYKCKGAPDFDVASIMMYPVPVAWTKNGFSASPGTEINDRDRACFRSLYN